MTAPPTPNDPSSEAIVTPVPSWKDRLGLFTVAGCLLIAALSWYLLKEFATLLRPLLLAVFLCYVIFPTHRRLTQRISDLASMILLAIACVGLLVVMAFLIVSSAVQLREDMDHFIKRGTEIIQTARKYTVDQLPGWLQPAKEDMDRGQTESANRLKQVATVVASTAADTLAEVVLVAIYFIFLLAEAARFPTRINTSFQGERPEQILAVVRNINEAMASYLRVKVKASLVLAVPVTLVLWAFGVKFALMWGVLTFFLNFVPYLGSVIACTGPILLAFLQMDTLAKPAIVAAILISIHMLTANAIEPAMTGKAIGISPLVILLALAFWGLCWGLTGMLLAVPLTVMLKIILEHVPFTQPLAHMMAED